MPKFKLFTADDAREHFTDLLKAEAERFDALAKDAAISMVRAFQNPDKPDMGLFDNKAQQFRATAANHLLRAETFRSAAALVARKEGK